MTKAQSKTTTSLAALERENKRMAAENARLEKQLADSKSSSTTHRRHFWRHVTINVCIILAGVTLVASNFLFWMGRSLLNDTQYNAIMTTVIQQPSVQQAVAQYATTQIFTNFDVNQYIEQVLPPKAAFLAPTLNAQIKGATQSSIEKVLASSKFQQVWLTTNAKAHERILNYIKNYQGNGTISLNDMYQKLSLSLQDTNLSFLANKQLPARVGSITVLQASWLPTAHKVVTVAPYAKWVVSTLFLAFCFVAVWLSNKRRRMVLTLAILFGTLMVITSVAARATPSIVAQSASPDYQAAAKDVAAALLHPLILQTRAILSLSVLTIVIAWISGSYPAAVATRARISYLTKGKVHSAIFGKKENKFTLWVGAHRRLLQWTSVSLIAFLMLLQTLSPLLVAVYALIMAVTVLLIETLSGSEAK